MKTHYTGHTFFDLNDAVSNILDPYLSARVSNSIAWRIDVMLVSAVREVFKAFREELFEQGIGMRDEITNMLAEKSFAEKNFAEIGSVAAGPITRFHELLDIRAAFVQNAVELGDNGMSFRGRPMTYIDAGVEARIMEDNQLRTGTDAKAKIRLEARERARRRQLRGQRVPENYEARLIAEMEAEADMQASNISAVLSMQRPTINTIYHEMLRQRPQDLKTVEHFHQLDIELQKQLIDVALQSADRAKSDARGDRDLSASFSSILDAFFDFEDVLLSVKAAPKFNNGVIMKPYAEPTEINGREAKAASKEADALESKAEVETLTPKEEVKLEHLREKADNLAGIEAPF